MKTSTITPTATTTVPKSIGNATDYNPRASDRPLLKTLFGCFCLSIFLLVGCSPDSRDVNTVFQDIEHLSDQELSSEDYFAQKRILLQELVDMWNAGEVRRARRNEVRTMINMNISEFPEGTFPALIQ